MNDALFHHSHARKAVPARRRALPKGYGLLIAAVVSVGLWGCIIWGVALAFR